MPLPSPDKRPTTTTLDIGTCATLACLWEATAAKPGNVHRAADFEDATFADFVTSAALIGPLLARAAEFGVGATVLSAVRATRSAVRSNTNLGTILLLAPLAAVPRATRIEEGIASVLENLDERDTRDVYAAIRLAGAGGLGHVPEADVAHPPPPLPLVELMHLAAGRDLVARQYTNKFQEVLSAAAPWIVEGQSRRWPLNDTLIYAHVRLMAEYPDSLIARKCGLATAQQAADRAAAVLEEGAPGDPGFERSLAELDFWLRSDGHRRNPGTTADLIAAGLFVLLREDEIHWPISFYGHRHE